jgi:hypothetical protein
MQKLLTKILKWNSKNSNKSESEQKKIRVCSKCEETKPLNEDNFQRVKHFRDGFSYYCNVCDKMKPTPRKK